MFDTESAYQDGAQNPDAIDGPADERESRPLRIAPDSYHEGKDIILRHCREVICSTCMGAVDVRKAGYASWRRELHTRLLREEDHYFGLTAALILAHACKLKVEIKVS